MRTLALATLMIGAALSPSLFAHETENLNYNIVNIQADAARQVANDEMRAVLYIERSNKQPAELSNQINQLMNQPIKNSSIVGLHCIICLAKILINVPIENAASNGFESCRSSL